MSCIIKCLDYVKLPLFILIFIAFSTFLSCGESNTESTKESKPAVIEQEEKKEDVKVKKIFNDMDFVMGRYEPKSHPAFVKIDSAYTDKAAIFLQKEAYDQFIKMHDHAEKDGIELKILSATRNFSYQRRIWERKWKKLVDQGMKDQSSMARKILLYSSMPGTSRHHWGTDIDMNYLSNAWFESGKGKRIYDWLIEHAASYGYCQPYTPKGVDRPNGYEEEKWHWSFTPLADIYFEAATTYLSDSLISGFSGAKSAPSINVVENYVLGINESCK